MIFPIMVLFSLFCMIGCRSHSNVNETITKTVNDKGSTMAIADYACCKDIESVRVLFPQSVAEILNQEERAKKLVTDGIATIVALSDNQRNFENTARAFDRIQANFNLLATPLSILEMLSPDDTLRNTTHEASARLHEFALEAFNNIELYNAFKSYINNRSTLETLSEEERYFLEKTMRDFKYQGLDLDPVTFAQLKAVKKEISKLTLEFDRNIAQDRSSIIVSKDKLAGISEEFLAELEQTPSGDYLVTVDYPTYTEIMDYCSDTSTRKALYQAYNNRAYSQNKTLLEKIIALRDKSARLIGFLSYAAFDLDDQMVQTPERAQEFIVDLNKRVTPKAALEFKEFVRQLPVGVTLSAEGKLEPWDVSFVKAHYKKKHFNLDNRIIAEYFPLEKTISGLFDIYQTFFDLSFTIKPLRGLWHDDVQCVQIYQKSDGRYLGAILLDLHPRPHKYSHACHYGFVSALEYKNTETEELIRLPSAAVVIANFPKPTQSKPALLKHTDVTTFFHEFGHAMHHVLGVTSLAEFAGTHVKTDFVELPSQMFEEWMWNKDILKQVSTHYKDGTDLPDTLLDAMIKLKKFDAGMFVQRQCLFSLLALSYFGPGEKKDVQQILQDLWLATIPEVGFDEVNHFYASFGHLTNYGAKYYGYMWSRVFAQDIFEQIRQEGLLSPKAGRRFAKEILSKGGSIDPNVLLKNYLGRAPSLDPFLRDLGL